MQTLLNPLAALVQAVAFAADKHRNQRRKDAEASPYINHPIALANVLANEGDVQDVTVLCAAVLHDTMLHDTIEDTETTADELRALFGDQVASVVLEVTDASCSTRRCASSCRSSTRRIVLHRPSWSSWPTRSAICATSWPRHPPIGPLSANRLTSTGPPPWSQACVACTLGWRRCLMVCMRGGWGWGDLAHGSRGS